MDIDKVEDADLRSIAKDGSSSEEILAATRQEGIELSDEELEHISGGSI